MFKKCASLYICPFVYMQQPFLTDLFGIPVFTDWTRIAVKLTLYIDENTVTLNFYGVE